MGKATNKTMNNISPDILCVRCGDDIAPKRAELGYRVCLHCGEEQAIADRAKWCVVQEYGKGNYQYVTSESALTTLKETNQKGIRR